MPDDAPDEVHGSARYEWERIVRRVVMPAPAKLVALTLATYADRDGTSIFPGNPRLAAVTCQSDKTVRTALNWLRDGYLIERVRMGSSLGRKAIADEYRLTIPSDLLTRHTVLDPSETPVPRTGDRVDSGQEHRYHVPVSPVSEDGTPVPPTRNTGTTYRPPTHDHPRNHYNHQRDDHVSDVTTRSDHVALGGVVTLNGRGTRR